MLTLCLVLEGSHVKNLLLKSYSLFFLLVYTDDLLHLHQSGDGFDLSLPW